MTYAFYLTNEYSQNLLTVRDVAGDKNKLFQYACTTQETPPPTTDDGYIWFTYESPATKTDGVLLYNSFSEGFLGVTGTIFLAAGTKPAKAQLGTLTFFPTQLIERVNFVAVQGKPNYYYIQTYINNANTNTYLVYDDEADDVSFMVIDDINTKNEHLNIMWKMTQITNDVPTA